jgi:GNAT superfamily N-acetyltransferase
MIFAENRYPVFGTMRWQAPAGEQDDAGDTKVRRSDMTELLPDGGTIRKLWIGETGAYRDHLLRLDRESRHRRFSGAVSDEIITGHAATANGLGVVVHGFFVDGALRGAAELRQSGSLFSHEAEAAFSIEQPWQSHGVGTELLERTLLSARNRGIKSLRMDCLAENQRMQQLARKFDAEFSFDFGSVVGEVDPPRSTLLSLMREAMADTHGICGTIFEVHSRLFRPA